MKIELVNPLPELEKQYQSAVKLFIRLELITLEEWNTRFKNFRDDCGYSMIHYLEAVLNKVDSFVTENPFLLGNRKELVKRFGVEILTAEEMLWKARSK